MRCNRVQGLFSEIYDGVAEEQTALLKHIGECPTCAAEYESYGRLINELRELPMPELPDNFHETIMAKIRAIAASEDTTVDRPKFEIHKSNKTAPPAKTPHRSAFSKTNTMAGRWASIAAAACLLLVSLWGIRVFDMPGVQRYTAEFDMPAPMSAPDVFGIEVFDFSLTGDDYEQDDITVFEPANEEDIPSLRSGFPIMPPQEQSSDDLAVDMGWQYGNAQESEGDVAGNIVPWLSDITDQAVSPEALEGVAPEMAHEADTPVAVVSETTELGAIPFMMIAADLSDHAPAEFDLPLTGGRMVNSIESSRFWNIAWAIAFAIGFAALGISLAAMTWSIYRKK